MSFYWQDFIRIKLLGIHGGLAGRPGYCSANGDCNSFADPQHICPHYVSPSVNSSTTCPIPLAQARGIEQINTAVSQMDQVTQANAAGAEESAAAAEELSSQSETMTDMVGELVTLVGGSSRTARHNSQSSDFRYWDHKPSTDYCQRLPRTIQYVD